MEKNLSIEKVETLLKETLILIDISKKMSNYGLSNNFAYEIILISLKRIINLINIDTEEEKWEIY